MNMFEKNKSYLVTVYYSNKNENIRSDNYGKFYMILLKNISKKDFDGYSIYTGIDDNNRKRIFNSKHIIEYSEF
jgi:hypothetical protein